MSTQTMTKTLVQIDASTGQSVEREMTKEEITFYEVDKKELAKQKAEADAKVAARESALAKLAALGLSAEEIAAL